MNSRSRSAAVITANCIAQATKWRGGKTGGSIPLEVARNLWEQTHPQTNVGGAQQSQVSPSQAQGKPDHE
jgi:hypothetical protein